MRVSILLAALTFSLLATLALPPGFAHEADKAPPASPGEITTFRLVELLKTPLEVWTEGEVIVSLVELPPGQILKKHTHPGEEFIYVLEGSATVWQEGKEDVTLTKGDVFRIPYGQVHTASPGPQGGKALVFRVHEKGKPERTLVE